MNSNKEILRILAECADECDRCYDACLENERTDELLRTLRLCRDCSKICRVTASFIASNSEHSQQVVDLCAQICGMCAGSCENHREDEHECKPCADICRECEEACRSFAGVSA